MNVFGKITQAGVQGLVMDAIKDFPSLYKNNVLDAISDTKDTEFASLSDRTGWTRKGSVTETKDQGLGELTVKSSLIEWEDATVISRASLRDDQTGEIDRTVREWTNKLPEFLDRKFVEILTDNAVNQLTGSTLFHDSMSVMQSGDMDNSIQFQVVDQLEPTAAEMEAAINFARARLLAFNSSAGNKINGLAATKVRVIVPSQLWASSFKAGTAIQLDSSTNVFANQWGTDNFVDLDEYNRDNNNHPRFYVHLTGDPTRSAVLFNQNFAVPEITIHGSDTDIDNNGGLKISGWYRMAMDSYDPRVIAQVTLRNNGDISANG